jgi:Asp-tRNA(Asn)/Glu-tRNA(Gln) amidotransferase A subunit family amidase
VRARHDRILSAEAARVHAVWFERHADLYAPKTADLLRRGAAVTDEQLKTALAERESFRAALRRTMIDHDLDLWICPSTVGPAPPGLENTGDPVMNLPWTQAGLPAVNLPAGTADSGLPLGLQLVGNWYKDESLLEWAAELAKVVGRP